MSEKKDYELMSALRLLAEAHTIDDHLMGYRVNPTIIPYKTFSVAAYTDAWGVVRRRLGLPTEPGERGGTCHE